MLAAAHGFLDDPDGEPSKKVAALQKSLAQVVEQPDIGEEVLRGLLLRWDAALAPGQAPREPVAVMPTDDIDDLLASLH